MINDKLYSANRKEKELDLAKKQYKKQRIEEIRKRTKEWDKWGLLAIVKK